MLCRYAPEKLELHAGTATCRFRTLAARRDNSLVAQILAHDGAARHHTAPSHVEQDDGMVYKVFGTEVLPALAAVSQEQ